MKVNQLKIQKLSCLLFILIFTTAIPVAAMAGTIAGNVVDSQSQPINGLNVQVIDSFSGSMAGSTSTNVDGDYSVTSLSTGSYIVYVNGLGTNYAFEYYDNIYEGGSATLVNVTQGETTAGIDFSLEAGGAITGIVTDANTSQVIENISIYYISSSTSQLISSTLTDVNGSYTISGLAPSGYLLRADTGGSGYAEEYYNNAYSQNSATTVNLTTGQTASGINFNLESSGTISGTVIATGTGTPIENMRVYAYDYSSGYFGSSDYTDVNGNYSIAELAPGNYRVWIGGSGTNYAKEFYNGTSDFSSASAVVVAQGAETTGIDFSAEPGATISGIVTDSVSTQNLANITICATPPPNTYAISCSNTAGDGSYLLTGIPVGSYLVNTYDSTGTYVREYYDGSYRSDSATLVSVAEGEAKANINFALVQAGAISGTVTGSGAVKLADVWVTAFSGKCWNNPIGSAKTDSNGNYAIEGLPPGDKYLVADPNYEAPRYYVQEWWDGADGATDCSNSAPLALPAGQTISLVNFNLELGGAVSGTVTGNDGQNLADVWVTAFADRCYINKLAAEKTDENGDFTIPAVPPGKFYLFADATYEISRNYQNEFWNGGSGVTDCNEAMALTAVAEQDITADFVLDHSFPVTFVEKQGQNSDGSIETQFEVIIEEGFVGNLPDDITEITISGPSGDLGYTKADFTYWPQFRDFYLIIPGSPEIGIYTATITSSDSAVAVDTKFQHVNRTLPIPDTATFAPADSVTLSSKTPTFSWAAVDYPGGHVYYRMWIKDAQGDNVFRTAREQGLLTCTVPDGVLLPGQTYEWYVRVGDNSDWEEEDNRSSSAWLTFTMAGTLSPHSAKPAIDPDTWGAVTHSNLDGSSLSLSVKVIDHDGVAYDGTSHLVEVTFPDGTTVKQLEHEYPVSPTAAEYSFWQEGTPQAGDYTFTVTDPDGNTGTYVDTLVVNPLNAPDEDSFTPSLKNPTAESITATFDNVRVNGQAYEDFDAYASIEDLDLKKWEPWYKNASIQDQKLAVTINDTIGRGSGGLEFVNPASIQSLQADITVTSISMDSSAGGRIAGTFLNNGDFDIGANIYVRNDRVTYSVSLEHINAQETYAWETAASGELMSASPGQTVRVSISWDGAKLTFGADDNTAEYIPEGNFTPPKYPYMSLVARMNLMTDTTPTFAWDPVPGANRYKVRIFSYDNNTTVWSGYASNTTSYRVPPGVLSPDAYYRYRIEARDAHLPLNVNNASKSPASSDDNYRFYTGATEAVDPYIELDDTGVQVWNDEMFGPHLSFWIKVHDAQGVPGDIKSVKVIYPGGTEKFLYFYPGSSSNTATGGVYRSTAYPAIIESGTYIFRVEDLAGNFYTITEGLTANNEIVYPDKTLMSPLLDEDVNGTAVDFDWPDVAERAFYRLEIYDTGYNRLYAFAATESQYSLPAGFLKEDTHYLYVVKTYREFFDQNVDNGSSSSWERYGSREFMTGVTTGGASPPQIDLMKKGAYIAHTKNPDSLGSSYWLTFEVKVTDPDGVPGNIDYVEVYYPGSVKTVKLRYTEKISDTEAIYDGYEIFDNADNILEGSYIFRVQDNDTNAVVDADSLVKAIVPLPANITPSSNSTVIGTTPIIDWDDVSGATRYRIRFYDGWDKPLLWTNYLTDSTHTIAPAVLSLNTTYSFRIYSYREQAPNEDMDNCSVNSYFYEQMPHFTTRNDADGDGVPDFQDAFPGDINEWLDTDSDGTGDNADTDDDNDGFADGSDAFPKDATEWFDSDNDGIGNNADPDDDNDGYADGFDASPTTPDAPGGANYNCTTDTRLYTISGNISYSGAERQPILVAVFEDAQMTTILTETEITSPPGSGPWSYNITNVPARNQYCVEAFMDFNEDEALDDGEPEGIIDTFDIATSMTGKDVELEGEGSAVKPMPWIPLLLLQED